MVITMRNKQKQIRESVLGHLDAGTPEKKK